MKDKEDKEDKEVIYGTGFSALDKALGGLKKGEVYLLAARPAMGRKTLARAIANHAVSEEKVQVLYYSDDDYRIYGVTEFCDDCRKKKIEDNIGLIVFDDVIILETGIMHNLIREMKQFETLCEIKKLALELEIPTIVIFKLGRQVDMRPDHRPLLCDLPEGFNEVADVVMFIIRDDYYLYSEYDGDDFESKLTGTGRIIVAKRKGPICTVTLGWEEVAGGWYNL